MKGKNNEDRYAVSAHLTGDDRSIPSVLAVVSDGIGGHRAGEVAAEIAVETISRAVEESDGLNPTSILQDAILRANQAIFEQANSVIDQKGMGATCACTWVIGDRLFTASVGDTRIYLLRGEAIQQITVDHTWIQEALDVGVLTPDEARSHPNAHVIRRYLGAPVPVLPDLRLRLHAGESDPHAEANQGFKLIQGDRLLLCSDGLTDLVEAGEIHEVLHKGSLDEGLHELVGMANKRGGHDNITLIALEVPHTMPKAAPVALRKSSRRWLPLRLSCALLLAALAAGVFLLGGLNWLSGQAQPTTTPTLLPSPVVSPTLLLAPLSTPTSPPVLAPSPTGVAPSRPTYTPWPTSTRLPGGPSPGITPSP